MMLPHAELKFLTRAHSRPDADEAARALHALLGPVAWLKQVHGIEILESTEPGQSGIADGHFTTREGLWLAVKTADCGPLLISTPHAVAAVHAGWRSAASGILPRMITHLCRTFHHGPEAVHIALGPCLQQANFEVEEEFIGKFEGHHGVTDAAQFFMPSITSGKLMMDLPGLLRTQALAAGVPHVQWHQSPVCTYAHEADFNSYRRHTHQLAAGQNPAYAVQFSLIRRVPTR